MENVFYDKKEPSNEIYDKESIEKDNCFSLFLPWNGAVQTLYQVIFFFSELFIQFYFFQELNNICKNIIMPHVFGLFVDITNRYKTPKIQRFSDDSITHKYLSYFLLLHEERLPFCSGGLVLHIQKKTVFPTTSNLLQQVHHVVFQADTELVMSHRRQVDVCPQCFGKRGWYRIICLWSIQTGSGKLEFKHWNLTVR